MSGSLIIAGCTSKSKKKKPSSEEGSVTSSNTSEDSSSKSSESSQSSTSTIITPTNVESVEVSLEDMYIAVGATQTVHATIFPTDADNKEVSWSLDKNDYVSISPSGLDCSVTANAIGESVLTVTTTDQNKTAVCNIHVLNDLPEPESVSLNFSSMGIEVGEQRTLKATLTPSNANTQGLTWNSTDKSVATVTNGTIIGIGAGTTTISVSTYNGKTASCEVTVTASADSDKYVPDKDNDKIFFITMNEIAAMDEEAGETVLTEYEFTPDKSVAWEQIYVNAPDKVIVLKLQDVTIANNYNSPIYVSTCDKIEISSKNTNTVTDSRAALVEESDEQGKGAIFVYDGDLKFKGSGTLNITTSYYNGIHGKDDVSIKNATINVTAPHHGIRGNDSLSIESGTLDIHCGKDGLCTKNSDFSSKGKQRGDITISGGTITINSAGDAIAAAHDVIINQDDGNVTINAYTGNKSDYSGATITVSENNFYLKMNSSIYASGAYTYAAYINDTWYPASYAGFIEEKSEGGGPGGWGMRPGPGGGGGGPQTTVTVYYKYVIEKPNDTSSFTLYRFSGSNVTEFSTTDYNAKSSVTTFNSTYDMVSVSSVSSKTITLGGWSNEDSNGTSQKGIKCENEIQIAAGTINLRTVDDGIHANYDGALENGLLPLGNVTISGGSIDIQSGDDGIHADYSLYISGGSINVSQSYEGIEGTVINISGGTTKVVASNDGVNARTGQHDSSITVSGGILDVTVPNTQDRDGIDSNGTYTQTGGLVITRGPNSTNMAALDTDGTARIDGGTIIVLGALGEKGLTRGSGVSDYSSSLSLHSSGSHTVTYGEESYTFTNSYSYSKTICYSSVPVTA